MAMHSSILAWRIPWTEEPGGLQSMGSQRVQLDWVTNTSTFTNVNATLSIQPTLSFSPCPQVHSLCQCLYFLPIYATSCLSGHLSMDAGLIYISVLVIEADSYLLTFCISSSADGLLMTSAHFFPGTVTFFHWYVISIHAIRIVTFSDILYLLQMLSSLFDLIFKYFGLQKH